MILSNFSRLWLALFLLGTLTDVARAQTYVAFGDSITFGLFDNKLGEGEGYPTRLQKTLRDNGLDANVKNRGVSGELTIEGVSRIETVLDDADVVLIMEGTNDIDNQISIETTTQNLEEMGRKARARDVDPILATVIPRPPSADRDFDNFLTGSLAGNIREFSHDRNFDLADPYAVFINRPGAFSQLYARRSDDPVGHPNSEGYDVLAEVFADFILEQDTVAPAPGLVTPFDGEENVKARPNIKVDLYDSVSGVNPGATSLILNGETVAATVREAERGKVEVRYTPTTRLDGVIEMEISTADLASPANSVRQRLATFLIEGTNFRRGDVDESGRVDGIDLITLAFSFGARAGDSRYFSSFDLVADGVIDGEDLAVVANSFGKS